MQIDSSTSPLYVGIDIGKNVRCYGGYAGGELKLIQPRQEVRNSREAMRHFEPGYKHIKPDIGHALMRVIFSPPGFHHVSPVKPSSAN